MYIHHLSANSSWHDLQPGDLTALPAWLSTEDALLARGMLRFGQDAPKLKRYFLPCKDERDILERIKSRGTSRFDVNNPIQAGPSMFFFLSWQSFSIAL